MTSTPLLSARFSALRERFDRTLDRVVFIQSGILLSVVYWVTVGYMIAVRRSFHLSGGWHPWTSRNDSLEDLRKQW